MTLIFHKDLDLYLKKEKHLLENSVSICCK
jgi:hypothetical protein